MNDQCKILVTISYPDALVDGKQQRESLYFINSLAHKHYLIRKPSGRDENSEEAFQMIRMWRNEYDANTGHGDSHVSQLDRATKFASDVLKGFSTWDPDDEQEKAGLEKLKGKIDFKIVITAEATVLAAPRK